MWENSESGRGEYYAKEMKVYEKLINMGSGKAEGGMMKSWEYSGEKE